MENKNKNVVLHASFVGEATRTLLGAVSDVEVELYPHRRGLENKGRGLMKKSGNKET